MSEKKMEELRKVLCVGPSADDLACWTYRNMPTDKLADFALPIASTLLGTILGFWVDAGASPELIKEYLSRFVDEVAKSVEKMRADS